MTKRETYKVMRGDWMRDGYVDDLAHRSLLIVIVDGAAYDARRYIAPCGSPTWPEDCRLMLCSDGALRAWGKRTSFSPDEGEVERIGAVVFATE